jgi:hypothetical protein
VAVVVEAVTLILELLAATAVVVAVELVEPVVLEILPVFRQVKVILAEQV